MKKIRLFTPGPTMVPEDVMLEMARPMDHHRTAAYQELLKEVTEMLQYLFQTKSSCLSITGSGTSAGEGAIVSCMPKGHKALCVVGGKFGERWAEICAAFDIPHTTLDVEWGHGATGDMVKAALDKDSDIDTVICVHSETSTAAVCDLESIAKVTKDRGALLIVDGITAVGSIPVKMDDWGVDVYFTGSQKALMLPPGLAFAAVSDRAWDRIDNGGETHAYYNCFSAYRKALEKNDAPYTPAITLMRGAHFVLKGIKERGAGEYLVGDRVDGQGDSGGNRGDGSQGLRSQPRRFRHCDGRSGRRG